MKEIYCYHCGRSNVLEYEHSGMCVDCHEALDARKHTLELMDRSTVDIQQLAAEEGIAIYERLPNEPLYDYEVVKTYLSLYPETRPTYKKVAEILNLSPQTVSIIAKRVHLEERFKAWVRDCDKEILAKRRQEMVKMNEQHISMASALRDKLQIAIDNLIPEELDPKTIVDMAKLARSLEKEARIDAAAQEELRSETLASGQDGGYSTMVDKPGTGNEHLGEVLSILMASGALKGGSVGVRTTQEVVVKSKEELDGASGVTARGAE